MWDGKRRMRKGQGTSNWSQMAPSSYGTRKTEVIPGAAKPPALNKDDILRMRMKKGGKVGTVVAEKFLEQLSTGFGH